MYIVGIKISSMKILKITLILFAASAFTFPAADIKLQYQFKVGDQYVWSQSTKQTIKQSVMGNEQNTENLYEGEFLIKVAETTATGAKLEASFTKLKNSTKSGMGENIMDSDGSLDKIENKVFNSMMNKPFFIYISALGNIEKIEGSDNLWSGFKDLGMEEQQRNMMQQSLEMMLGPEALKSSFQSAFVTYPEKKVKQGDKWTVNHDVVVNFAMSIENTWNVESLEPGSAKLYGEGVYKTTDKEKTFNLPGGIKAKSDLDGRQAVKSAVNTKTGWPSKQEILVELKGKMTLLAGGMIPQDMEVPMEIVSETTYLVNKK